MAEHMVPAPAAHAKIMREPWKLVTLPITAALLLFVTQ
jgi:hypothetical protein